MPKSFSNEEREYIKGRLKEEAAKCIEKYGIRRTTVDEIVRRAGIAKGTFYLFYPSKETLLFEVISDCHKTADEMIYREKSALDPENFSSERFGDMLFRLYELPFKLPLLKALDKDSVSLLARKLPKGVIEEHFNHDDDITAQLFTGLPLKKDVDLKAVTSAFQSLYFSTLYREEIGAENFDAGLKLLINGLIKQLF